MSVECTCETIYSSKGDVETYLCPLHRSTPELIETQRLKAQVEELQAERKKIFSIMFKATEKNLQVQYRGRRWKSEVKWVDCAKAGPSWNWMDYEYRIKEAKS
jgi:hypothetical protein